MIIPPQLQDVVLKGRFFTHKQKVDIESTILVAGLQALRSLSAVCNVRWQEAGLEAELLEYK